MRLLVIGGTRFLGRHLAEQALAAGHEVTLLHRGRSGPGLFPQARHFIADRDREADLAVLEQGTWDAAIDTSAYVPRQVRTLAARLQGRVGQYQLVSTISVYASMEGGRTDEDAPVVELPDPMVEQVTGETYGGLKVLCERAAAAAFSAHGTPCLVARPGLLVGPFDPTGRFTWWVQRLARGGPTLAPGAPGQPVQFIDARDAAAWLLKQADARRSGTYNLTGPIAPLTLGSLLEAARDALASAATAGARVAPANLEWVDEAFLLARDVAPWTDLPLWLPREQAGLHRTDIRRAVATGLTCRPVAETVVDMAAWLDDATRAPGEASPATGPAPRPTVGLAPEREQQILQDWRAASGR
jgi:2'-hydroxyisoflavone reductase